MSVGLAEKFVYNPQNPTACVLGKLQVTDCEWLRYMSKTWLTAQLMPYCKELFILPDFRAIKRIFIQEFSV